MEEVEKPLLTEKGMDAGQTIDVIPEPQKSYCLNCHTPLADKFCSHCGQKDIPKRQTLGELFSNFISSFWSYESKFFKTCQYLLFRPGFLATEYNAGRRERYYHPARMYVFISFVYFFLFTSLPDVEDVNESTKDKSTINFSMPANSLGAQTLVRYDSLQATLPNAEQDGWLKNKMKHREFELRDKISRNPNDFTKQFTDAFKANFSKIFFYLLPVFAFILWLLYSRHNIFYSEHLVFSIYYYNFFFMAGSLFMILNLIPSLPWITTVIGFLIFAYLLLAMKRTYKQSWKKTIFKCAAFLFAFGICVVLGLFVNLFITLMYI